MRDPLPFLAALVALSGAAATAAPVSVQVLDAGGRPLAGAVVTVTIPGTPAPPAGHYAMAQRDIRFEPALLIVPVGATVAFPNFDKVRHHVYSFSRPKPFDLKLYGRDETRSVTFDKAGVVAIGCNIHDAMNGVVFVADTPFAAQTDATGRVRLNTVATARAMLAVWHPTIRAPGNRLAQPIAIAPAGFATTVTLKR